MTHYRCVNFDELCAILRTIDGLPEDAVEPIAYELFQEFRLPEGFWALLEAAGKAAHDLGEWLDWSVLSNDGATVTRTAHLRRAAKALEEAVAHERRSRARRQCGMDLPDEFAGDVPLPSKPNFAKALGEVSIILVARGCKVGPAGRKAGSTAADLLQRIVEELLPGSASDAASLIHEARNARKKAGSAPVAKAGKSRRGSRKEDKGYLAGFREANPRYRGDEFIWVAARCRRGKGT